MQISTRTISPDQKISVRRLLPILGQVLVQKGQKVSALDTVARVESPSRHHIIDVAKQLAKPDVKMDKVMLKSVGEMVEIGEQIAVRRNKLAFLQKSVCAPVKGLITAMGQGWVLLETQRTVTQIQAFINGTVSRVIAHRGVVIETNGTVVESACGFGGEAYGLFKRLVDSPTQSITADELDLHTQGMIILAGQSVDEATLRKAEELEVRGLVVGSIDASLLRLNPPLKICVVATEGFGDMPMSPYTFGILRNLNGREISIRGITPSLASSTMINLTDETALILSSTSKGSSSSPTEESKKMTELVIGNYVRVTRGEFLGVITTVEAMPFDPQPIESGIVTLGLPLMIEGAMRYIPLANLEQIGQ